MPSPEEMAAEKERLYESASLRDDLNDLEATVLLKWGEGQIERLAQAFPTELEQKARFLRQLLKNINRFVGQREFNDIQGQAAYMSKIIMYLEPLGWTEVGSDDLFAALPEDKADMAASLDGILAVLSPQSDTLENPVSDNPSPEIGSVDSNDSAETDAAPLENSNPHSITQLENDDFMGVDADYGEED